MKHMFTCSIAMKGRFYIALTNFLKLFRTDRYLFRVIFFILSFIGISNFATAQKWIIEAQVTNLGGTSFDGNPYLSSPINCSPSTIFFTTPWDYDNSLPIGFPFETYETFTTVSGPIGSTWNLQFSSTQNYFSFTMSADGRTGYYQGSMGNVPGSVDFIFSATITNADDSAFSTCGDVNIPFSVGGLSYFVTDDPNNSPIQFSGSSTADFPLFDGKKYGRRFVTFRHDFLPFFNDSDFPIYTIDYYPQAPTLSISDPADPKCFGNLDGKMTINLSNVPSLVPYFRLSILNTKDNSPVDQDDYSPGSFPKSYSTLGDGTYSVKIANIGGDYGTCSNSTTKVLTQPTQVQLSNFKVQPTKCKDIGIAGSNINSGSISATASGGSDTGFTYYLDGTALPSNIASGLAKKTYTFSAKDSNLCPSEGYDKTVGEPAIAMGVSLSSTSAYYGYDISCNGASDGSILATPSLAVPGYTFEWYTQPGNTKINGQTAQTLPGRPQGGYSVKLTDGNGCIALSSTLSLVEPPAVDFAIDSSAILQCIGGKMDLTASPASTYTTALSSQRLPLSYLWDSGEVTAKLANKGKGLYGVTVRDKQGCNLRKTHRIVDPPGSTVTLSAKSFNGTSISCAGRLDGELYANVQGAASSYTWYKNGASFRYGTSLSSLTGLEKGNYKVVIAYNLNCQSKDSLTLSEPDTLKVNIAPSVLYNQQPISCYGKTDARLLATANGGTLVSKPYTYKWDSGDTTVFRTDVGAGIYKITVTDANGCIGKDSITLINPTVVKANIDAVSNYNGFGVSCFGSTNGSITAGGTGGTGDYKYKWSNDNTLTTSINSNLAAGTYSVIVADQNQCKDTIEQVITAPTAIGLITSSLKDVSCFSGADGSVTLNASGGVLNTYTYSKDGVKFRSLPKFDTLQKGAFTFTVRDINGCTTTTNASLTEPEKIDIKFKDIEPALCRDSTGAATAEVTGGVSGYTYTWKNPQGNSVGSTPTLVKAKGGIYTLTVHDSYDCIAVNTVPITSLDGAKSTYDSVPAKCFNSADGSALITILDGIAPFTIKWPGEDEQSDLQHDGLARGTYYVSIKDGLDCTVIQTVEITAPDALQVNVKNQVAPSCNGACDGQLQLEAVGGVGAYTYAWNNSTNPQQVQLCAGNYPLIVKDGNDCTLNQTIELKQPDPIDIKVTKETLATCKDGCDGSLEIAATGGNGNYAYTWAVGGNTPGKNNLCPGAYAVTVIDPKGCSVQKSVILKNTPPVPLDLGGGKTVCVGQSYILDAGNNWTSISWGSNTGFTSTQSRVTIKNPGSYWIEALNDKGCVAQDTFLLETSTDLLKASFMIPQRAMVGDTVAIIDVSWPLPEFIEWDLPISMRKVRDLSDVIFGQFYTAGTYAVGLTAHLGECLGQVSKTITILPAGSVDPGGRLGYEEYVKEFTLYPNPTDGSFEVGVELLEEAPISLSVWGSTKGVLLNQVSAKGKSSYKLFFDLRPLASGAYVVRLDHAKGKAYLRFIVY